MSNQRRPTQIKASIRTLRKINCYSNSPKKYDVICQNTANPIQHNPILVILGVTFDSKMTFEKHLRSVSSAASQRLGILRKSWRVFHDRSLLGRYIRGFFLPVLEYCSAVWYLAADTHLKPLDRAVRDVYFLTGVCLSAALLVGDPWQYCECCIRSDVTPCTL